MSEQPDFTTAIAEVEFAYKRQLELRHPEDPSPLYVFRYERDEDGQIWEIRKDSDDPARVTVQPDLQ